MKDSDGCVTLLLRLTYLTHLIIQNNVKLQGKGVSGGYRLSAAKFFELHYDLRRCDNRLRIQCQQLNIPIRNCVSAQPEVAFVYILKGFVKIVI